MRTYRAYCPELKMYISGFYTSLAGLEADIEVVVGIIDEAFTLETHIFEAVLVERSNLYP